MTTTEEIESLRQHVEHLRRLLLQHLDAGNAPRARIAQAARDEALARLRKLEGQ